MIQRAASGQAENRIFRPIVAAAFGDGLPYFLFLFGLLIAPFNRKSPLIFDFNGLCLVCIRF
jgi:hypothetical protein